MAWTTPFTAVAGSIYTAAQANQIRDNLNELRGTPQYRCSAYSSVTQTVTGGAGPVNLTLNSEEYDTASMHTTGGSNHLVSAPAAGGYFLFGKTHVANTAAAPTAYLYLNRSVGGGGSVGASQLVVDPTNGMYLTPMAVNAYVNDASAGETFWLLGQAVGANVTYGDTGPILATRLTVVGPMPPA